MRKPIGITTDGRPVWGFFDLHDTHGLPLEVIVGIAANENLVLGWGDFFTRADRANWNLGRLMIRARNAISDSFGTDVARTWDIHAKCWWRACAPVA